MISSVSARGVALLCLALLWALPANSAAPGSVSLEVAGRVAAAWKVAPEAVRVEWSDAEESRGESLSVARLLGRGRDGWFAVVLRDAGGRSSCRRIRAGVEARVMVAARDLPGGTRLFPQDLRAEQRVFWGAPTVGASAALPGAGWEVRRPIAAGEVVGSPAARPPLAIEAGQMIDVEWRNDAVRVTARGVALNSARTGESVRVRVAGREQPLFGRVTGHGSALLEEESK
jgi:flagella basal body P-ring formation protein FlgA